MTDQSTPAGDVLARGDDHEAQPADPLQSVTGRRAGVRSIAAMAAGMGVLAAARSDEAEAKKKKSRKGPTGPQGPQGPAGGGSSEPGPTGPQGTVGPTGPQGSVGGNGIQGPTGNPAPGGSAVVLGEEVTITLSITAPNSAPTSATFAVCPLGYRAISFTTETSNGDTSTALWQVQFRAQDGSTPSGVALFFNRHTTVTGANSNIKWRAVCIPN